MLRGIKTIFMMHVLAVMLFFGQTNTLRAQQLNEEVSASLLTCSPGDIVYELYGHTAIMLVHHRAECNDSIVFNYGVFDFSQPNFIWRFMLGKTDYMVQGMPYFIFEEEYIERGSSVIEQRLNLTQEEAIDLELRLLENAKRENRMYRYNFLTCNCTTQVRDKVESSVSGKIIYEKQPVKTYRESLHAYLEDSPWARFGDDILLGAKTDTLLSAEAYRFLPYHLKDAFATAKIRDQFGNTRPLVAKETVLLKEKAHPVTKGFPLSPLVCALLLLAILFAIAAFEYVKHTNFWICDLILMPGVGVIGILLTFMALFSEHPTVGSNWQVWVFNPLPLLCTPWVVHCAIKHKKCAYHYFNAATLALFIVAMPWIPQHFSDMTLPLALGLLTRPVSYILNSAYIGSKYRTRGRAAGSRKLKKKGL